MLAFSPNKVRLALNTVPITFQAGIFVFTSMQSLLLSDCRYSASSMAFLVMSCFSHFQVCSAPPAPLYWAIIWRINPMSFSPNLSSWWQGENDPADPAEL